MSDSSGKRGNRFDMACTAVTGILVCGYFVLVWTGAANIPYLDDFDAILRFINAYTGTGSISERLSLIFSRHYDHRTAFARLVALAVYYLYGSVNFKTLILIGNAALAGLLGVLYTGWAPDTPQSRKSCRFLPAVFLLLQPQYHETIFWSLAALQNIPVLFFSCAALYYAACGTRLRHTAAAFMLAAAAMVTSGNGCLAVIGGCAVIAFRGKYRQAAAWGIAGLGLLYLYYSAGTPVRPFSFTAAFKNPSSLILHILIFMGAAVVPTLHAWIVGTCLSVYFVVLTLRGYYRTNLFLYAVFCFLLLTAAAVGMGRSHYGCEQALASRYRIYSVLFITVTYLTLPTLLAEKLQQTKTALFRRLCLTAALIYWSVSCAVYVPRIAQHKNRLLAAHRGADPVYAYPDQRTAGRIIAESRRLGTYSLPD